jgi:hypothetical protein
MTATISQPFTNVQLELLRVFSHQIEETALYELRKVLAQFFAQRAIAAADTAWEQNGWTDADVDRLLTTKLRRKK